MKHLSGSRVGCEEWACDSVGAGSQLCTFILHIPEAHVAWVIDKSQRSRDHKAIVQGVPTHLGEK